jgi:hypothetical protein
MIAHTSRRGKNDRGPDHGICRIVSLVSNRRLLTVLHCSWEDFVAILRHSYSHSISLRTDFDRLNSWFLNYVQSPALFLRIIGLD